jgi:hypothetical protein
MQLSLAVMGSMGESGKAVWFIFSINSSALRASLVLVLEDVDSRVGLIAERTVAVFEDILTRGTEENFLANG